MPTEPENWKEPASGEWIRAFAIITTDANELVTDIHDRMPVILAPSDYARWLSLAVKHGPPPGVSILTRGVTASLAAGGRTRPFRAKLRAKPYRR